MTLIDIALVVFIFCVSSLSIFTGVYLKRIFEQVEAVRKDIHRLTENTIPVLNSLEEITLRTNRIVAGVEQYWEEIDHLIRNLHEKISNFGFFKKFNYSQPHTSDLIKNLGSIQKGISTFWKKYKHV